MTDMEGAAGVQNSEHWCEPSSRYYELGKEFLTKEVNAAAEGFFAAGAKRIVVADGHGHGGLSINLLDPRLELIMGWSPPVWPFGLDRTFDYIAWVGQHAKAGSVYAHLAHTGTFSVLENTINGISVGEFGGFALLAQELGVKPIFGSGDYAFTLEAKKLVKGIETVPVKKGLNPKTGTECSQEQYRKFNLTAMHIHPVKAREMIRHGAEKALRKARGNGTYTLPKIKPPYERLMTVRHTDTAPKLLYRQYHTKSITAMLNSEYKISGCIGKS